MSPATSFRATRHLGPAFFDGIVGPQTTKAEGILLHFIPPFLVIQLFKFMTGSRAVNFFANAGSAGVWWDVMCSKVTLIFS